MTVRKKGRRNCVLMFEILIEKNDRMHIVRITNYKRSNAQPLYLFIYFPLEKLANDQKKKKEKKTENAHKKICLKSKKIVYTFFLFLVLNPQHTRRGMPTSSINYFFVHLSRIEMYDKRARTKVRLGLHS